MRNCLIRTVLMKYGLAVSCLFAPAAHAGFEWAPPPLTVSPAAAAPAPAPSFDGPAVTAMPVMPVDESDINGTAPVRDSVNIDMWPLDSAAPASAGTSPVTVTGGYAVAEGFGRDLPLALVMSQIVPKDFAYDFGAGVDQGVLVSWTGGKPWNIVLQDAVAPAGLVSSISGGTVRIARAGAASPPVPLSPVSASAPPAGLGPTPMPDESPAAAKNGPFATGTWRSGDDETLHAVLDNWCRQAGVRLFWNSPKDYRLADSFVRQGTFADAVQELLGLYDGIVPEPMGRLHSQTPDGIAVLVITSAAMTN